MPRWFETLKTGKPGAMGPGDGRLIGEVNHAAGNLVHRMYYWTGILEEEPRTTDAAEAVEQLKDSLGELHRLVNRTMDLVGGVQARPITAAAGDVVRSVAMRLGCPSNACDDAEVAEALGHYDVNVDPVQVDRAIGMLGEALVAPPPSAGSVSALDACVEAAVQDANGCPSFLVLQCTSVDAGGRVDERIDSVTAAVSVALATKLLSVLEWRATIDVDEDGRRRLTIYVPIEPRETAVQAGR